VFSKFSQNTISKINNAVISGKIENVNDPHTALVRIEHSSSTQLGVFTLGFFRMHLIASFSNQSGLCDSEISVMRSPRT
jgi:hypothetical protein